MGHSSFSNNRDRLLEGEIAAKFLAAVLAQPQIKRLLSRNTGTSAVGALQKEMTVRLNRRNAAGLRVRSDPPVHRS